VGIGLAEGKSVEAIVAELGEVAEGVPTTRALHDLAVKHDLYLPIADEVYAMIYGAKDPRTSVRDLLG
jgi:glycerol-3-phosphate dehydrogenase (NAD(P)+)